MKLGMVFEGGASRTIFPVEWQTHFLKKYNA